jgi:cation:H+ antiporter
VLLPILWFIAGLIALIGGAELMVRSVSKLAVRLGISKLIIGLTVVAFGTSAPELAVSIQAGVDGNTDLMLGNIVGSNITNTLLILGISALVIPLKVHTSLIKADLPIMIGITILVYFLAMNGFIYFWECVLLTTILIVYLIYLIRNRGETEFTSIREGSNQETGSIILHIVLTVTGLVALVAGARWLISSSLVFAEIAGVSELVIGLTVVAIGTSLPEIVVALVAAIKGERDIAVGGVIGSNILNFLAVLGVSGLFIPGSIPVQESMVSFDLVILIGASILCIPIFYTGHKIVRWEGALFLFFYFSYIFYLFLSTTAHDFLSIFINIMTWFVLPVTVLTVLFLTATEFMNRFRFRTFKGFRTSNRKNKSDE